MTTSTGIVVAAGVVALADVALTDWNPAVGVRIAGGTVLAALVSAGLDKVVPRFGTGCAVVLLVASLMKSVPRIADQLFKVKEGFGPA